MRGKIFVIEGTDCSGKETQTKLIVKRLIEEGYKCKMFSFPNYETPAGKIVGGPLLGNEEFGKSYFENVTELDPKIACLYFAADRKYNLPEIEGYLEKGYNVFLDRYTTSNLAYQGIKIEDKDERFYMYEWIDKLEYWLLGLPKPDKTIFLHVPYDFVKELIKSRKNKDEYEKSGTGLVKKAIDNYIELTSLYNWDKIECVKNNKLKSIKEINEEIYDLIKVDLQK